MPLELISDEVRTARTIPTEDAPQAKSDSERKREVVTAVVEKFKLVAEAEAQQRRREIEDLKFDRGLPEDQWPADVLKQRAASVSPDGSVIAERPSLVINKIEQPVQQVVNEARQARLGIEIKAKGDKSSRKGAELRQGMIRAIEMDSGAQQARLWALERAVKCGRGYYRILTEYAQDGDFDLDLRIDRILNQGCVYFDPYAAKRDKSDAEWVLLTETISREEYQRRWPDSKLTGLIASADVTLSSVTDQAPGWITDTDVRIAECYYVEHTPTWLIDTPEGKHLLQPGEGVPIDPATGKKPKARKVDVKTVKWCVVNGLELLDEQDWPGKYLPIIPVDGKEYVVDGQERVYKGMVSNAKDAQRSYNYMRSAQVETIGLAAKAPWMVDPVQIEGYEGYWQKANTANLPYLPYHQYVDGQQYAPPTRNVWEPAIQAITIAVREAEADVKATTGRFDPSLGQMSGERSGRAIKELKQQGENSSSHYLENLAAISMVHEGRVLLDLLPKVYDRPGRIVKLLGEEPRDERQVMLGVPFVPDQDGRPQPAPAPRPPMGLQALPPGMQPPGMAPQPGAGPGPMPGGPPAAPQPQLYTLDDGGEYTCEVTVGRAFATQREANLAALTSVIEATKGAAAPLLMDLYAELLEGSIGSRMAQRFRKANPNLNDEGDVTIPPEVQAQMQQMQQQLQQVGQALQQAQQQLATESYKVDAQVAMKEAELASEREIALERVRADLVKAKATLDSQEAIALLEAEEARLQQAAKHASATALERLKATQKRREIALEAALTALTTPPAQPVAGKARPASAGNGGGMGAEFVMPEPGTWVGPSGAAHDPRE